jgi:hypothetical protein
MGPFSKGRGVTKAVMQLAALLLLCLALAQERTKMLNCLKLEDSPLYSRHRTKIARHS